MTRRSIGWIAIMTLCASGIVSAANATEIQQSAPADAEKKVAPSPASDDERSDDRTQPDSAKKTETEMTEMEFNTIEVITTGRSDNLCAAIAALELEPNRSTR